MRVVLGWQYAVLAKKVYGLNELTCVLDSVVIDCLAMSGLGAATTNDAASSTTTQSEALKKLDPDLNIISKSIPLKSKKQY